MIRHIPTGFGEALLDVARRRPSLVVIATEGAEPLVESFSRVFPDRIFRVSSGGANALSMAAALALCEKTPVVFTAQPLRFWWPPEWKAVATPIKVVRVVDPEEDEEHAAGAEELALVRAWPSGAVVIPGDEAEAQAALEAVLTRPEFVYLRLDVGELSPRVPALAGAPFRWGQGALLRTDGKVLLCATGVAVRAALAAAEQLAPVGVPVSVLHLPTVKPLDEALLVEAARPVKGVVTVEPAGARGGLGSAVAECLAARLPKRVYRVGMADVRAETGTRKEAVVERLVQLARQIGTY